jgi:hypothetical protein
MGNTLLEFIRMGCNQDTGYGIQDTGYGIRDTGYGIRDTGYGIILVSKGLINSVLIINLFSLVT